MTDLREGALWGFTPMALAIPSLEVSHGSARAIIFLLFNIEEKVFTQ